MLESISPYALLKASKPKPPAVIVTPYDLYSTVQSTAQPVAQSAPPVQPVPEAAPAPQASPAAPAPYISARRTHYIRDIETRHDAALRRATLQPGRMAQPSAQWPQT